MRRKQPENESKPERPEGEHDVKALNTRIQRLRNYARICPVTGIKNYRNFREVLPRLKRDFAAGRIKPYGLVALDIKNFSKYNDRYNHLRANQILREFAKVVATSKLRTRRRKTRSSDTLFRWGGDEFVVLVRDVGTRPDLEAVVDRLKGPHVVEVAGLGRMPLSCYVVGLMAHRRGLDSQERSLHRMLAREKRRLRAAAPRRRAR